MNGVIKRFRLIIEPKQFKSGHYTDANDEHIRN